MCISKIFEEKRLKSFLNELAKFESQKNVVKFIEPIDYSLIATSLNKCRKCATEKLRTTINELQIDDPLNPAFLGVSLLRILHGTGLRETAHTRLLTWLLNPREDHGFGLLLLRAFMSHIAGDENPWGKDESLKCTFIQAERMLSGKSRRTDIWIEGTVHPGDFEAERKWLVVVEAKVESSESDEQLAYYEKEANDWFQKNENNSLEPIEPLFVFLSIHGDEGQTVGDKDWITLTFQVLSDLLWTAAKNKKDAPGINILRHYITGILTDMYGWQLPIKPETDNSANIYSILGFLRPHHKILTIL